MDVFMEDRRKGGMEVQGDLSQVEVGPGERRPKKAWAVVEAARLRSFHGRGCWRRTHDAFRGVSLGVVADPGAAQVQQGGILGAAGGEVLGVEPVGQAGGAGGVNTRRG
jgi:hypothetical protein